MCESKNGDQKLRSFWDKLKPVRNPSFTDSQFADQVKTQYPDGIFLICNNKPKQDVFSDDYMEKLAGADTGSLVEIIGGLYYLKTPQGWQKADTQWVSMNLHDNKELKEKRWARLQQLGYPVAVWHGTNLNSWDNIRSSRKHAVFTDDTFTSNIFYASEHCSDHDNFGLMSYSLPADGLHLTRSLTADKIGLSSRKPYEISDIPHPHIQNKTVSGLDLDYVHLYDYDSKLIQYLRSSRIKHWEAKDGEKTKICVPLWQNAIKVNSNKWEIYDRTGQLIPRSGRLPRAWWDDLSGEEVIKLQNGTIYTVPPAPIIVP